MIVIPAGRCSVNVVRGAGWRNWAGRSGGYGGGARNRYWLMLGGRGCGWGHCGRALGTESGFPIVADSSSNEAMRTLLIGSLALSAATLVVAETAQPAPAAEAPAAAAATDTAAAEAAPAPVKLTPAQEKQAFMAQGYIMAHQMGVSSAVKQLRMDPAEVSALVEGIALAAKGEQLPFSIEEIIPGAQALFSERAAVTAKEREAEAKVWGDSNAAFLAKVDADTAVTKTASGLRYQIIAAGAAEKPTANSTVKARYTGKLCDGKVFDSTEDNGQPVEFALSGVIKGWTEGLQLIGKGGKIHLWVPADLGYGSRAGGPIPASSVLEFEVELVDFK